MTDIRPTNERTTMVVAEWKKISNDFLVIAGSCVLNLADDITVEEEFVSLDPRDKTDAANNLLAHIINILGDTYALMTFGDQGWCVFDSNIDGGFWPLKCSQFSGQSYRYAVVELAISVFEFKKENND